MMVSILRDGRTIAIALATWAALCFPNSAQAQVAAGKIVYTRGHKVTENSQVVEYQDIYMMNADGTNAQRLTTGASANPRYDSAGPAWSPDGTKIVFFTNRHGKNNTEIYVMDAKDENHDGNGDNLVRLTDNAFMDEGPTWSATGNKIAFACMRAGHSEKLQIYSMNADGSNQTRITNNQFEDYDPSWAPGGNKLAFTKSTGMSTEVYVIDANGANEIRLTSYASQSRQPAWSPDGNRLIFESNRHAVEGNIELYTMDSVDLNGDGNGDNLVRLTETTAYNGGAKWSPSGTQIAFHSNRQGNNDIFVMNANGTNPLNITNSPNDDYFSSWYAVIRCVATTTPKIIGPSRPLRLRDRLKKR